MSARLLLLCPGQGGQHEGMNAMALGDPRAAAFLEQAAMPSGALFDNLAAQPAVVGATLAMWLALQPRLAALRLAPALVAGYSVGELSAWGVAGAISPPETVRLAHARAKLMTDAAAAAGAGAGQTLAAIGGLPLARSEALAAANGYAIAIVNGEDSCVAGGMAHALPALRAQVEAAGGRLQHLPVTVAAHTPLLAKAVRPFADLLAATPFSAAACPVLSGVDAVAIDGAQAKARAVDALSRQLSQAIRWADCMDAAAESGIGIALELGPGAALARMLASRHRHIACRSVAEFRGIDGIVKWLERQADLV